LAQERLAPDPVDPALGSAEGARRFVAAWLSAFPDLQVTIDDLIAMTTHGRSGLGRALLGSVAEEVVWTAPCPVLLVRNLAQS
jgi:nucleotide-binding universal stress UspA family protein